MQISLPTSLIEIFSSTVKWSTRHSRGQIDANDARELADWREVIGAYWCVLSQAVALNLRGYGATIDTKMPGFITLPVDTDGKIKAYIPFYLAELVPTGRLLLRLAQLGQQIRLNPGSVICLSGSTCQSKLGLDVGDVDFCEYLPHFGEEAYARLREWTKPSEGDSTLLCRVRLADGNGWTIPWADSFRAETATEREESHAKFVAASHRQCVFASAVDPMGVLEVTNLVLELDFGAPEATAAAHKSFAAQEVPLTDAAWTPRDLSDPLHFGRYISWLLSDAEKRFLEAKTLPKHAVKCARRLISAARLLTMYKQVDELVNALKPDGARLAVLKERCELYARLSALGGVANALLPGLRASIDALRKDEQMRASYDTLTAQEQTVFEEFRDTVMPLLERIKREIKRSVALDAL